MLTVSVPEAGTSIEVPITVTAVATAIENVTAPVISGKPKIGRTLTATGGTWSVESPTLAFQWNRNGTAISSATAASYTLVAADAGAKITVTVTASKAGSLDGAATSAEVGVPKGKSSTSGSTNRTVVFGNQPVTYTVTVRGDDGVVPTGEVAIYDGTRKITTVTLTTADNGRITVPVSLGRGIHLLTARYLGSDTLQGSIGSPDPVIRF